MSDTDALSERLRLTNEQTLLHIRSVQRGMSVVVTDLLKRAAAHDDSKLCHPEVEGFATMTDGLSACTYGSAEYAQFLRDLRPTLAHHYKHNDHHPEHFLENCVWKPLADVGFPAYEVSDRGIVRKVLHKELVPVAPTATGHERVQLVDHRGQICYRRVHTLVAAAHVATQQAVYLLSDVLGSPRPYWISAQSNLSFCTSVDTADQWDARLFGKWLTNKPSFTCEVCPRHDFALPVFQSFTDVCNQADVGPFPLWKAFDTGLALPSLDFAVVNTHLHVQPKIPNLLASMSLPQLMEMAVDWAAAVLRHRDGDPIKSIYMNAERFGYGDDWRNMLLLTWDQFYSQMSKKAEQ